MSWCHLMRAAASRGSCVKKAKGEGEGEGEGGETLDLSLILSGMVKLRSYVQATMSKELCPENYVQVYRDSAHTCNVVGPHGGWRWRVEVESGGGGWRWRVEGGRGGRGGAQAVPGSAGWVA